MSKYQYYLSVKDKAFLKSLAKHIKDSLAPSVKLTSIQNSLANGLGYPDWGEMEKFNAHNALFTDLSVLLRVAITSPLKSLDIAPPIDQLTANVFKEFAQDPVWSKLGGDEPPKEFNFCLLPLNESDDYELIAFRSELELLERLEKEKLSPLILNPVIKIDKRLIKCRERPYTPRRPILKFLESHSDIIFIESDSKVCYFNYIPDTAVNISNPEFERAITRGIFYSPSSYMFRLFIENDLFLVRMYKESLDEEPITSGAIKISESNKSVLESRVHPTESYSCVEDAFTLYALDEHFSPIPKTSNSYFDFCRLTIAKMCGCTLIPRDLQELTTS